MKSIGDILTGKAVVSLPESASAHLAAQAMAREKVGAILVLGARKEPRGIFTERDLMVRIVVPGEDPAAVAIGSAMTTDLFTAEVDDRVNEIAQEMQRRHIRHLPVREGKRILEILSFRDLLRAHLEVVADEKQALQDYIQGDS